MTPSRETEDSFSLNHSSPFLVPNAFNIESQTGALTFSQLRRLLMSDSKLSGSVFGWQWVRYFSPFINIYSFIFLVGGAIYSATKYALMRDKQSRLIGNVFIAVGAILPGIGGSFTRMGYVNVLFVTELIGLALIYAGYRIIKADKISVYIDGMQKWSQPCSREPRHLSTGPPS